jgi:CRP-like cAMP-binding protein
MQLSSGPFEQLKAFYTFIVPTLSEESWQRFEAVLTIRNFKKGAMILTEGQPCTRISFINNGIARMYYSLADKEKTICFFNENSYVSDYQSFLTQKPARINIQALSDTEVVETSYKDLQLIYQEVPEANLLGRLIAEQLFIKMNEGQETEVKATIEQRYQDLINEQPWLLQQVPQYMIASYLGITPEALSRARGRMNRKGKVNALIAR